MATQSSDYISASSYVRVLEKKLLGSQSLERAADAAGPAEALRLLSQNSDYNFGSLARPDDCEALLKAELKRVYKLLLGVSPHREVIDLPGLKYDCHNLKAALKEKLHKGRTPPPYMEVTDIAPSVIEAAVAAGQVSALKSDLPAHLVLALDEAWAAWDKTENPQSIDIAVDKAMFRHMLTLCGAIENGFITDHVKAQIDFYNLKTLLRARNMQKTAAFFAGCLVPGGATDTAFFAQGFNKTAQALAPQGYYKIFGAALKKGVEEFERSGNFSQLERLLDNYLVEQTKKVKTVTYGPEILYAYLVSKENEVRQVRILLAGKQNGIRAEALRERLRESYA
jgi:V/A-type H+-transporting ATPase subunit C